MTDNKNLKTENEFTVYLEKINFQKHLKKIEKILKNKKVLIYGAGSFFQTISNEYDLSNLNIIAISDRKFINHDAGAKFQNYQVCSPDEITALNPDYVLVSMLYFVSVIEDLEETCLKNSKIKIKPLINKPFWKIWKEIRG